MLKRSMTPAIRAAAGRIPAQTALQLQVQGIVQGVGFRPFIFDLAGRFDLCGWVRNTAQGVEIWIEGSPEALQDFQNALQTQTPPLAQIETLETHPVAPQDHPEFTILPSSGPTSGFQPISPDVGLCPDCRRELFDPADRRFRYPFINCTNCGPRYTITLQTPYDRPFTTMAGFELCPNCAQEYHDPADRRFHAQPVACPRCGPAIWLESDTEPSLQKEDALQGARRILASGRILALKGLGGFHLACDAGDPQAVARLRERKDRPEKPLAIMVFDLEAARRICHLSPAEARELESIRRPIVLLRAHRPNGLAHNLAPGSNHLGVMLPYTPLHMLLLEPELGFPQALVMTSGNPPGEPIVIDNQAGRKLLAAQADAFLLHDRPIHARCDDSLIQLDQDSPLPIRRARGFAPLPIKLASDLTPTFAAGGQMKNTFCFTRGRYALLSPHIGELENLETLQAYQDAVAHYEKVFDCRPALIAYDLHPDYLASRFALQRAAEDDLPAIGIQHHHAHAVACMAEHHLPDDEPVIGVIYDGTGYGPDGTIWGGEILVCTHHAFHRARHLAPIPLPGGEAAIRQPWRLTLAWLQRLGWDDPQALPGLRDIDSAARRIVARQIEMNLNAPPTSSMGRLFDAAAALAGVCSTVSYEAQAAIAWEALADPNEDGAYPFELRDQLLDPAPTLRAMIDDLLAATPAPTVAARFHQTLANMTHDACCAIRQETGLKRVVLSGGVWQNRTLAMRSERRLRASGFELFTPRLVPANDGGLALGQAVAAAAMFANGLDGYTSTL